MNGEDLENLVREIIAKSRNLIDRYNVKESLLLNYSCIFAKNQEEYDLLLEVMNELGEITRQTHSGPLFRVPPFQTLAGELRLLKIHTPDQTRAMRGYTDFILVNYLSRKSYYLSMPNFKFIERPDIEMIELMDPKFDVRVYFSSISFDNNPSVGLS